MTSNLPRATLALTFFIATFSPSLAFAAFYPGETLDPGCTPYQAFCYVDNELVGTSTRDQRLHLARIISECK